MLNYILPPIIIIACVSYLIVFLFRKVEQIPQQELFNGEANKEKKMAALTGAAGQLGLKILERMMHRIKLLSLRFHNTSNDLFQSIREKRQQKARLQQETLNKEVQKASELPRVASTVQKPYSANVQETTALRPTLAAEITRPEKRIVEKNKFEDVLIKRIAVNPRDIEAYERLGDYYLENRNYEDSLECFKQVLHLSPMHQKARLRIRRLQRLLK